MYNNKAGLMHLISIPKLRLCLGLAGRDSVALGSTDRWVCEMLDAKAEKLHVLNLRG